MYLGLVILITVMALCAVVGTIYAYIYVTRIYPLTKRLHPRALQGSQGSHTCAALSAQTLASCCSVGAGESVGARAGSSGAHAYLFRK